MQFAGVHASDGPLDHAQGLTDARQSRSRSRLSGSVGRGWRSGCRNGLNAYRPVRLPQTPEKRECFRSKPMYIWPRLQFLHTNFQSSIDASACGPIQWTQQPEYPSRSLRTFCCVLVEYQRPRHQRIIAFCACRRFSASSKITECGPSITAEVASSSRCAGRQCINRASGFAIDIKCSSTR